MTGQAQVAADGIRLRQTKPTAGLRIVDCGLRIEGQDGGADSVKQSQTPEPPPVVETQHFASLPAQTGTEAPSCQTKPTEVIVTESVKQSQIPTDQPHGQQAAHTRSAEAFPSCQTKPTEAGPVRSVPVRASEETPTASLRTGSPPRAAVPHAGWTLPNKANSRGWAGAKPLTGKVSQTIC